MTLLLTISTLALILGTILPLRWGVFGFLAAAALVFLIQFGINTASGFNGTSLEESLLLFDNAWGAYLGFNLQITYRAFALPLLALASPLIFRLARANR
ncbi:hypothetical protein [uncultured Tateyamaria sp.]|uniref:hypothetical protein n=1 Tax=uncultured Tateyamaria sp. TaxID=455651 RepID=UPI00261B8914|nr:hypothetical protein [uncultured Tateyamaria sp.]